MGQRPRRRSFVGSGRAAPYHKDRRAAAAPSPRDFRKRPPRRPGDTFEHRTLRNPRDPSKPATMVILHVDNERVTMAYRGEDGEEQFVRVVDRTTFERTYT